MLRAARKYVINLFNATAQADRLQNTCYRGYSLFVAETGPVAHQPILVGVFSTCSRRGVSLAAGPDTHAGDHQYLTIC